MSEKVIRFNIKEIKTIRIVCKKCGGVVETPITSARDALTGTMSCRFCNTDFSVRDFPRYDALGHLETAAEYLGKMEDVEVQFVFPGDD